MSEILNVLDVNSYNMQGMKANGGGEVNLQSKDITITENGITTIEPDEGYDGLSNVDVNVSGILDTSDATAVAKDLAKNKTAYVNGQKITGSVEVLDINNMPYSGRFYSVSKYDPYVSSGFLTVYAKSKKDLLIRDSTALVGLEMYNPNLANAIHLTPEKLKKDEVILGVTGTYEGTKAVLSDGTKFQGSIAGDFSWLSNVDTSNLTNMANMFNGCAEMTNIGLFDTSNVVGMFQAFYGCTELISVPLFDTKNNTMMISTFNQCSKLKNVPVFNTSKVNNMSNCFVNCTALSDESLNNIMQMCINATSYSSTQSKTLSAIGIQRTQATKCQTLSNYQAFLDAGWTTGY